MAYKVTYTKEDSLEQLKKLVNAFSKEYDYYKSSKYSEAQLRIDFINPLLKTFGWDVDNEESLSQFFRTIIQEEPIDVEENDTIKKKNPDYTLRVRGIRKIFIEAKKASIDVENSITSAFQTRRYGWNGNLGLSILTNFDKIVLYDCRYKPNANDNPSVARYSVINYKNFIDEFEKLYNLLSFESVNSGFLDNYFSLTKNDLNTFDQHFLTQIEKWRYKIASDIILNNKNIDEENINLLIQRLLNRIIFLRICEDREIEKYETLKSVKNYNELKTIFIESDRKYNSGLFDFIEDNFSLNINLNSEILVEIFNELYYPESPYKFSVVDPLILSQIYEKYLGSKIIINDNSEVSIIEEPEVAASSGVVPTPKIIVDNIIRETLDKLFIDKSLEQIKKYKIADICCGSGTFLISLFDYLLEKFIIQYENENIEDYNFIKRDGSKNSKILTIKAKQEILLNNIYGVDINPYAVEVTKFSLLLKLLENENSITVNEYLSQHKQKVLPNLDNNIKNGNSLIDEKYFEYDPSALDNNNLLFKLKPFNWNHEFNFLNETKGFDAIIGNPPYVRIQNMVKYIPDEIKYYQNKISGYTVAYNDTFDKYYLFIQKAISLINSKGILGYIVPNKFFINKGGKSLRELITKYSSIYKIIHFGVLQVFPNRSTYTTVIILDKLKRDEFSFKRVKNINKEFLSGEIDYSFYKENAFSLDPWIFLPKETNSIFEKIRTNNIIELNKIAEIPVGLQTSADKIFIIVPKSETEESFFFIKDNVEYEIEKSICKPCIYDLSFELFDNISPNAQLIFPYHIISNKAEVFDEEYFINSYPLAWKYLNLFKEKLSKRSINGSKEPKWYQFGRSQSLTKFHNNEKLIWPVLSLQSSYIFDNKNIKFTGGGNGPYYSLVSNSNYSILYILGILSHPLFEAMIKYGASEFRGAYYSHGKQFIENIPIKQIDFTNETQNEQYEEIVNTVKSLLLTNEQLKSITITSSKNVLERKIDYLKVKLEQLINKLYDITDEELKVVLTDEAIRVDLLDD